jgi:glycosyltransferase domain-containing protein
MEDCRSIVSLVMPTYGRPALVLRQIMYLSRYDFHLIIADGSRDPIFQENNLQFDKLKITYIHEAGEFTYPGRLFRAIELCETEFLLLMDDSDIYLPSSIQLIAKKMQRNHQLMISGQVSVLHNTIMGARITNWGHWSDDFSLLDDKPEDRINKLIANVRTANLFYSIFRTENLLQLSKVAQKFSTEEDIGRIHKNIELIVTISAAIAQKYLKTDIPFHLRVDTPELSLQNRRTDRKEEGNYTMQDFSFLERFFQEYLDSYTESNYSGSSIKNYLFQVREYLEQDLSKIDRFKTNSIVNRIRQMPKKLLMNCTQMLSPKLIERLTLGGRILEKRDIGEKGLSVIDYFNTFGEVSQFEIFHELINAVGLWMTYPLGIEKKEFIRYWERNLQNN